MHCVKCLEIQEVNMHTHSIALFTLCLFTPASFTASLLHGSQSFQYPSLNHQLRSPVGPTTPFLFSQLLLKQLPQEYSHQPCFQSQPSNKRHSYERNTTSEPLISAKQKLLDIKCLKYISSNVWIKMFTSCTVKSPNWGLFKIDFYFMTLISCLNKYGNILYNFSICRMGNSDKLHL